MNSLSVQLETFFGAQLKPVTVTQFPAMFLNNETENFLQTLGLPVSAGDNTSLAYKMKEISLIEFYTDFQNIKCFFFENQHYFPLGFHEDWRTDFLCLKEKTNEVFYLQNIDTASAEVSFVNSSLELHLFFWLLLFHFYLSKPFNMLRKERAQIVRILKKEFRILDKLALADENSYWSVLVEQIEDGLL